MDDPYKMLIDLALPEIKGFLAEAAKHKREQTKSCVAYLRAAQKAVEALHKEFECIIVDVVT